MELASMLAGEPFSDHPRSVSRPLAAFLRGYNDALDDTRRQTLKPYASACVGTAGNRAADRRRRLLARRALIELRLQRGTRAATTRRWPVIDLLDMGVEMGLRVRKGNDSELHRRMLGLIEALIAVGATSPPLITAPVPGEFESATK
jgi:hypothetical protein